MTEQITLKFSVGDTVRRNDGVEFVVDGWEMSYGISPLYRGWTDNGHYHLSREEHLTLINPGHEQLVLKFDEENISI